MEQKEQRPWVKLHLANQTDQTNMPPFVIGVLQKEDPVGFTLSHLLEMHEDDNFEVELKPRAQLDFINRTYVWRVEILDDKPLDNAEFQKSMTESGGLG